MKVKRHAVIREIIENTAIETQEELAAALRARQIDVTQATVSRDIKTMMLVKVPAGNGRYRYALPKEKGAVLSKERMARLFYDSVVSLDYSENIIVVKTLPGAANAVANYADAQLVVAEHHVKDIDGLEFCPFGACENRIWCGAEHPDG